MEEADDELQANIDAVNADLQTTKTGLSDEVARGAVRDATLQDHEARVQLLRTDTDANSDAIANLNADLIININNVTEVINENANSGSADLDALKAYVLKVVNSQAGGVRYYLRLRVVSVKTI